MLYMKQWVGYIAIIPKKYKVPSSNGEDNGFSTRQHWFNSSRNYKFLPLSVNKKFKNLVSLTSQQKLPPAMLCTCTSIERR